MYLISGPLAYMISYDKRLFLNDGDCTKMGMTYVLIQFAFFARNKLRKMRAPVSGWAVKSGWLVPPKKSYQLSYA
jgi:hypothetical protein